MISLFVILCLSSGIVAIAYGLIYLFYNGVTQVIDQRNYTKAFFSFVGVVMILIAISKWIAPFCAYLWEFV